MNEPIWTTSPFKMNVYATPLHKHWSIQFVMNPRKKKNGNEHNRRYRGWANGTSEETGYDDYV